MGEAAPEWQRDFLKGPQFVSAAPWCSLGPCMWLAFSSCLSGVKVSCCLCIHIVPPSVPMALVLGLGALSTRKRVCYTWTPVFVPGMVLGVGLDQVLALGILRVLMGKGQSWCQLRWALRLGTWCRQWVGCVLPPTPPQGLAQGPWGCGCSGSPLVWMSPPTHLRVCSPLAPACPKRPLCPSLPLCLTPERLVGSAAQRGCPSLPPGHS